jgi:hypothetical protein
VGSSACAKELLGAESGITIVPVGWSGSVIVTSADEGMAVNSSVDCGTKEYCESRLGMTAVTEAPAAVVEAEATAELSPVGKTMVSDESEMLSNGTDGSGL